MTYELSETPDAARDTSGPAGHARRLRLNKVPEVTVYFWVIKVLCTTVGETAADLLNEKMGLGLTGVSVLMSVLLAVALVVQFRTSAYRAGVYWLAVALISVVGTLISDNLTDNMGVPLQTSTVVFAAVLAVVFIVWYRRERTLSIHSIDTTGREAFYWLAVLFTFALGTAAGDLVSERMDLGYWLAALLFAAAIGAVAVAHFALGLNAVWSFWIAYILTRPLGASIGDYLSQPNGDGGLGLGTVVASGLFLAVILALVVYLSVTRRDVAPVGHDAAAARQSG
ncbi:COG4705 family protein [Streptomyces sp. SGAir0957]